MPNIGRKMHRSALSGRTLAQVERDHIVATLHATNWVLGGWDGAAARLGLSRTTLISRMQRLGISAGSRLRKPGSHREASQVAKRTLAQPQVVGLSDAGPAMMRLGRLGLLQHGTVWTAEPSKLSSIRVRAVWRLRSNAAAFTDPPQWSYSRLTGK